MTFEFMRALTHEPIFEDKDKTVLSSRITSILDRLSAPISAMDRCIDYLDDRMFIMTRDFPNRSFEMRNRNPYRIGTMAWLKFMRKKCLEIKTAYVEKLLASSL